MDSPNVDRISQVITSLIVLLLVAFFSACAVGPVPTFAFIPIDISEELQVRHLRQTVDHVMVLVDASSSMDDPYQAGGLTPLGTVTEFDAAREILRRLVQTIPDIELRVGLDTFGFGRCLPWNFTDLHVPLSRFSRPAMLAALDGLKCAGDGPSLVAAIGMAADPLATASGRSALILISDGEHPRSSVVQRITALTAQFGGRLCLYTVWVGNIAQSGKAMMAELPKIAACGTSTTVKDIASSIGMAEFVTHVLFDRSPSSLGAVKSSLP